VADEGLVPGRECGDCTVCCTVPTIDDPEIQKKPGIRCRHCEAGCTIYPSRPKSCRDFYCAWRMIPALGPDWRPDRSGVFGMLANATVDGKTVVALTLMLIGDAAGIVANHGFVSFVRANLLDDRPIFLSISSRPGHVPLRTLLKGQAMTRAARQGEAHVRAILDQALRFLLAQPPKPYELNHSGNDAGAPVA
jgi:hypothetical protein